MQTARELKPASRRISQEPVNTAAFNYMPLWDNRDLSRRRGNAEFDARGTAAPGRLPRLGGLRRNLMLSRSDVNAYACYTVGDPPPKVALLTYTPHRHGNVIVIAAMGDS